eukprot:COSAG02_NODE_1232_length_13753_cov_164.373810_2_plen_160_part_00
MSRSPLIQLPSFDPANPISQPSAGRHLTLLQPRHAGTPLRNHATPTTHSSRTSGANCVLIHPHTREPALARAHLQAHTRGQREQQRHPAISRRNRCARTVKRPGGPITALLQNSEMDPFFVPLSATTAVLVRSKRKRRAQTTSIAVSEARCWWERCGVP